VDSCWFFTGSLPWVTFGFCRQDKVFYSVMVFALLRLPCYQVNVTVFLPSF